MIFFMTRIMKHKRVVVVTTASVVVILACLLGARALNADPSSANDAAQGSDAGISGMIAKVVLSLLLLMAILYGGVFAMRRVSTKTAGGLLKQGAIAVIHRQAIGPKKAIYVIKIAKRAMVVGVTDSQITHLADLSEEDLEAISKDRVDTKPFKQTLLGALGWTGDRR